jgi:hypothetical protein
VVYCGTFYGSGTRLLCNNGSCNWINVLKPVLEANHGQSVGNLSYEQSLQAVQDAAADLISCSASDTCASEFLDRGTATNGTLTDSESVGDDQSQIACALVAAPGTVAF